MKIIVIFMKRFQWKIKILYIKIIISYFYDIYNNFNVYVKRIIKLWLKYK